MDDLQRLDGADILVVSPTPTWPLDFGNRKRIFSICDNLKKRGATIHFLHYPSEGDWRWHYPKAAFQMMTEQWDYVYTSPPTRNLHEGAKEKDHTIDEWWDAGIESQIKWLFSVNHFDAIIVNYTWLSKALELAPPYTLKVLDTHDRFSDRGDLLEAHGISREFFHTTQEEEAKGLERADLVWAIKEDEEIFFRELLEKEDEEEKENKVSVETLLHVENHSVERKTFPCEKNGYLTIGMIGARNNINLTNAYNFLKIALPILEAHMTPVRILIAGTMCTDMSEFEHPFVEFLGRVETVESFYEMLDVAIVPMTFSTGLKIKVGEALSYGIPLMSHKHAFEGYPPSHDFHQFESLEEMAMEIVKMAYEPKELATLKKATEDSQKMLIAQVDETLDDFVTKIKEHLDTAVIILPEDAYKPSSLYHLHIDSVMGTLFEKYRIIMYYPYALDEEKIAFLDRYSDWVKTLTNRSVSTLSPIMHGMTLEALDVVWDVKLLWSYAPDFSLASALVEKECIRVRDISLLPTHSYVDEAQVDVVMDSLTSPLVPSKNVLHWSNIVFSYNTHILMQDIWKGIPAEACETVYVLFSGSAKQYAFWKLMFDRIVAVGHPVVWVTEFSEETPFPDETIDVSDVLMDVALLKKQARIVFEINLKNSHLVASLSWLMHISKRLIVRPKDLLDTRGKLSMDVLYKKLPHLIDDLKDAEKVSEFNNAYAYKIESIDDILSKYNDNKLKKSLDIF